MANAVSSTQPQGSSPAQPGGEWPKSIPSFLPAIPSRAGIVDQLPRCESVHDINPRDPTLLAWLAEQERETELAMRMAMRAISERCRGDRAWKNRIDELTAEVAPDADSLSRVLRRSRRIEKTLLAGS